MKHDRFDSHDAAFVIDADPQRQHSLRVLVHVLYALHGLSILTYGLTGIVAVIINYAKRRDVAMTLYATHFSWQIQTFWWAFGGFVLSGFLFIIGIGYLLWWATVIWTLYRIVRGWLAFNEGKPIGAPYIRGQRTGIRD